MNAKQAKKARKRQRRVLNQQIIKMFDDIVQWPLKERLKLAWRIAIGKPKTRVQVK